MANNSRFNHANKALGEANTMVIINSIKAQPKTINELIFLTGLTRQTIVKRINQNTDVIQLVEGSYPKKYYIGDAPVTIPTENIEKAPARKLDAVKAAVKADLTQTVFFPNTTHNDHSRFHDHLMNSEDMSPLNVLYRTISSKNELAGAEHSIKTLYDLIQFRKTLGEFE